MIKVPMNKAIVPVYANGCINGCIFFNADNEECAFAFGEINCSGNNRKNGKNVIFKLIDRKKVSALTPMGE